MPGTMLSAERMIDSIATLERENEGRRKKQAGMKLEGREKKEGTQE